MRKFIRDKIKNKPIRIVLVCLIVLGLGAAGVLLVFGAGERRIGMGGLRVYHFNAAEGRLQSVNVSGVPGDEMAQLTALLAWFYHPPGTLTGLWPEGMQLVAMDYYDGLVGIALPGAFREMSPLDEALFRTALTLTFLELPFVERVLFWVEGEGEMEAAEFADWLRDEERWDATALRVETAASVENNPSISPGLMQMRTITLYFVCAEGEGLVTETFEDEYVDSHRLAEFKLQRLIAGSEADNVLPLIPPETSIRMTNYDGFLNRLYVDLSGEFMSRFIGTNVQARLMLQSIVNTLTLPANNDARNRVEEVFFLIDSNRLEVFHGVRDFDRAFSYDQYITLVVEEPDPVCPYGYEVCYCAEPNGYEP